MTEATRPLSEGPTAKRVHEGPRGGARTWYEVLEVAADVSAIDLKKAYDRAIALVEGRSIGGYLMLDPVAAESARADVEAAFAVLGDGEQRRAYDEQLGSAGEEAPAPPREARDKAADKRSGGANDDEQRNAREMLAIEDAQKDKHPSSSGLKFTAPAEPSEEAPVSPSKPPARVVSEAEAPARRISIVAPAEDSTSSVFTNTPHEAVATIPPEAQMPAPLPPVSLLPSAVSVIEPGKAGLPEGGEIAGALIKEIREARGLTLEALAEATKIRKPYLRAVEEEDIPNLPARVYLRGFLTQVARVLKVDRARLAEGYLLTIERITKEAPPSTT